MFVTDDDDATGRGCTASEVYFGALPQSQGSGGGTGAGARAEKPGHRTQSHFKEPMKSEVATLFGRFVESEVIDGIVVEGSSLPILELRLTYRSVGPDRGRCREVMLTKEQLQRFIQSLQDQLVKM